MSTASRALLRRHRCTGVVQPLHIPPGRPRGWSLAVGWSHTRNGAGTGRKSRGPHRAKRRSGPVSGRASRQILKEHPPDSDHGACSAITAEKQKGPEPFGVRASAI